MLESRSKAQKTWDLSLVSNETSAKYFGLVVGP